MGTDRNRELEQVGLVLEQAFGGVLDQPVDVSIIPVMIHLSHIADAVPLTIEPKVTPVRSPKILPALVSKVRRIRVSA